MKRSFKNLYIISILFAVISALAAVIRIAALSVSYDSLIGYYKTGAVLPLSFHLISAAVPFAAMLTMLFLPKKSEFQYQKPKTGSAYVCAGSVFSIVTVCAYLGYISLGILGDRKIYTSNTTGVGEIVEKVALFLGIASVIYFLLVFLRKTEKGENHTFFGYGVILFVLMVLAKTYFDFFTTMNSPNKLLLQITFMSVMIYMLFELRFSLGNAAPGGYAAAALTSFYFCLVCSVPGIAAFFSGIFTKNEYFVCHFLCLGFGVYIGARFISFILSQKALNT